MRIVFYSKFDIFFIIKTKCTKNYFCGFEPAKKHCEFKYTTNEFQDESWDLSNFICYEGSRIDIEVK